MGVKCTGYMVMRNEVELAHLGSVDLLSGATDLLEQHTLKYRLIKDSFLLKTLDIRII